MKLTKLQRQHLVKIGRGHKEILAMYLFGSQAKGGVAGPLSDVDIGLLIDPECSGLARERLQQRLFQEFSLATDTDFVDVIDLSTASVLLRYRILFEGEQLLDKQKIVTQQLIFKAMRDYEDFRPHLETQQHLIVEKINQYVTI